eukprot:UN3378
MRARALRCVAHWRSARLKEWRSGGSVSSHDAGRWQEQLGVRVNVSSMLLPPVPREMVNGHAGGGSERCEDVPDRRHKQEAEPYDPRDEDAVGRELPAHVGQECQLEEEERQEEQQEREQRDGGVLRPVAVAAEAQPEGGRDQEAHESQQQSGDLSDSQGP